MGFPIYENSHTQNQHPRSKVKSSRTCYIKYRRLHVSKLCWLPPKSCGRRGLIIGYNNNNCYYHYYCYYQYHCYHHYQYFYYYHFLLPLFVFSMSFISIIIIFIVIITIIVWPFMTILGVYYVQPHPWHPIESSFCGLYTHDAPHGSKRFPVVIAGNCTIHPFPTGWLVVGPPQNMKVNWDD